MRKSRRVKKSNPREKRVQIRAMLAYLGVPIMDQPIKLKETEELYNAFKESNPEQHRLIYKAIVHGIIDNNIDVEKVRELKDAEKTYLEIMKSEVELERSTSFKELVDISNRTISEVKDEVLLKATEAIEEAKDEFRKVSIEIKIGKRKAKNIDGIPPQNFKRMLQLAQQRKNIFLTGPAGCGKTYAAEKIAEGLDLQFSSQSCSAGMSESMLTGWLLPIGDSGKFNYVPSEFVRIYEEGGVFLLDEMDAADPNVLVFINNALAGNSFTLPQRFENPLVKKHKDFICVAATNTFGNGADATYHGRNALDGATMDRFRVGIVEMSYSDELEQRLVDSELLSWGLKIRKKIYEKRMLKIMSTRVLLDGTDMIRNQGWTIDDVAESFFADWSREEKLMCGV